MPDPTDAPAPGAPYQIPRDGSLTLLALGWRGLDAWRTARPAGWLDARREAYEAARARLDSERAASAPVAVSDRLPPAEALRGIAVTVVSGLPRSGTSMLMQMLVAGGLSPFTDAARTPDASNPRGYYEHDRVKALATDARWVPDAAGHAVKVVANLLPLLPPGPAYRVVVLDRDIGAVLRSQTAMLARLGRPAADAERLRAVYEGHLRAALRWADATPGVEILVVSHADVIADPVAAAARIADVIDPGLSTPLDRAAMAATVDPSLHRERT